LSVSFIRVWSGQQLGTTTLLRREKMLLADGCIDYVPMISGNTFRGWLRRVGEDLLREHLRYDGQLSLTAAHALRGGGALAKTMSTPCMRSAANSANRSGPRFRESPSSANAIIGSWLIPPNSVPTLRWAPGNPLALESVVRRVHVPLRG
jgi:hypothetical protein